MSLRRPSFHIIIHCNFDYTQKYIYLFNCLPGLCQTLVAVSSVAMCSAYLNFILRLALALYTFLLGKFAQLLILFLALTMCTFMCIKCTYYE